jgi:molybdopterin synthase catalytic subunit
MSNPYLTPLPLDREALRLSIVDPAAGAILVFEGTVRNHSDGLTGIIALEYQAQISMASKIIENIIKDIQAALPIQKAIVQHRIGLVPLGEATIIIAVSSAHRDEAYRASRLIIDRIKHEAPIWKREMLANGQSQWSRGCMAHGERKPNS